MFRLKKMKGEYKKREIRGICHTVYCCIMITIFIIIWVSAMHDPVLLTILIILGIATIVIGYFLLGWIIDKLFERNERKKREKMRWR